MNRIDRIISYLNRYVQMGENREIRHIYLSHIFGVAQFASMIALKRGLDAEITVMAALLHDIKTLDTLDGTKHAKIGAQMARQILTSMNIATDEEVDIICTAISHHSKKGDVHSEYDEALKDADVLQHTLYNPTQLPMAKDVERFARLCEEFGMVNPFASEK